MNKKKMIIILSSVIGVIILIIVGFIVFNMITNKNSSYSQIEDKMIVSAQRYYQKYKDRLPSEEQGEITIETSALITEKYLDDLSKFTKKGVSCSGSVTVRKNGSRYLYIPKLNCGDAYQTKTLSQVILEKTDLSDNGSGLYEMNGEHVYRGENPSNFVKFANQLWRIVKVDAEGDIALIAYDNDISKGNFQWDDRFNAEKDSTVGINDYQLSRIREKLVDYISNTKKFTSSDLSKIVSKNLCIGARDPQQEEFDGASECTRKMEGETIGLITTYDYLRASTDPTCKKTIDFTCQNYNYLSKIGTNISSSSYWTLNASSKNTYDVYRVYVGSIAIQRAASTASIRPVIYLHDMVMITGGNGTEATPYVIR